MEATQNIYYMYCKCQHHKIKPVPAHWSLSHGTMMLDSGCEATGLVICPALFLFYFVPVFICPDIILFSFEMGLFFSLSLYSGNESCSL